MNDIKKSFVENLIDVSLHKLGELSVKLAESSADKCCECGGFYETKFPEELIMIDEE
ncbi:cyclic lactone autoinducer peptide [Clostridium sp.]|uniref:cyclic lactone autoinducer peptide n=1 Tax=Clostridium sp. TaxID=1506 RepID=UPI00283F31C1|nr:cyclic lactone autoinducer peptide [Clostridium sp.]MDR3596035.1 cyclic lactone autoinducer peptide [Clostridium sp.]